MSYTRTNRVQSFLYVTFCLMIILAGGVFLADRAGGRIAMPIATMEPGPPSEPLQSDIEAAVLAALGPIEDAPRANVLVSYLIWAIQTGKSDDYIDTLLNSAAARGHFGIPAFLKAEDGRLDTAKILHGVMAFAAETSPKAPNARASVPARVDVTLARYRSAGKRHDADGRLYPASHDRHQAAHHPGL